MCVYSLARAHTHTHTHTHIHMSMHLSSGACRSQKRESDFLKLKLQAFVNLLTWVLGTEKSNLEDKQALLIAKPSLQQTDFPYISKWFIKNQIAVAVWVSFWVFYSVFYMFDMV